MVNFENGEAEKLHVVLLRAIRNLAIRNFFEFFASRLNLQIFLTLNEEGWLEPKQRAHVDVSSIENETHLAESNFIKYLTRRGCLNRAKKER